MKIELPAAIVIAGALIATAIYVTNETPEAVAAAEPGWTGVGVASTAGGVTAAFVLNTETGEVRRCYVGVGNNDCTSVPHH